MTPDPQLRTQQLISETLSAVGITRGIRFNLPRGKVARVWGFSVSISRIGADTAAEFSLFVRKARHARREDTPQDSLWAPIWDQNQTGTNRWSLVPPISIMFPKPYRTVGLTVQMHASETLDSAKMLLIIYYDIDDMIKGEATEVLEKSVQRGRTRRTSEFD